jgi:transcription termination/antitermination protein NusA
LVRLKLDQETLGLSLLMERISGVRVKDCFRDEDVLYFVVSPGYLGKAIGKGGANIKKIQTELGKKIRIIEFRDNMIDFVKNVIYPLKVAEVVEEENIVYIKDPNKKTKSLLIGRDGKNLKLINRAVKRFFSVDDVKVI